MTVKELRQIMRRSSFVYPFLIIHFFATSAVLAEFHLGMSNTNKAGIVMMWNFDTFSLFWGVAIGICGLIMPLAGLLSMPQEIEEGNHEILLLTKLSRGRIVIGKFITLWGTCLLTFTSLLPYIIVRYFIGGIEWPQELANAATVMSVSAMITAASLAASGYKHHAAKIGALAVFSFSLLFGGTISMLGSTLMLKTSGTATSIFDLGNILFHLCSLIVTICYSLLGILVARSRLRLATFQFEIKPSSGILILVGLAPILIGMSAAITCGYGSIVGIIVVTILAWNTDSTPKPSRYLAPPVHNIPKSTTSTPSPNHQ